MKPLTLRGVWTSIAVAAFSPLSLYATAAESGGRQSVPQLSRAVPADFVGACEDLAARLAGLPNTVITASTTVPAGTLTQAGQPIAEHCLVTGRMDERVSPIDGKTYAIGFEMRLPKAWNGRFFHQGNGGIDGNVVTALGALGGGPLTGALFQGFAVLSSDTGHTLAQGGPAFGLDPQARLDYGYQAVGKLTPMAKEVIRAAYGKRPDRSYFGGCSNGGRHTLVAAARYPKDYDGFLAGSPGYRLPLAALANIFGAQRYASVATGDPKTPAGLETGFTAPERMMLSKSVLSHCDALDGAVDGMIQDVQACQKAFNFMRDVPTCVGERDGTCLSTAQKVAIAPIFSGATTADGRSFYSSFPFDAGEGASGIPFWEFTAPLQRDSGAVGVIFQVPPSTAALTDGPAFSLGLDIGATLEKLYAGDGTYTESAMIFMTPPADNDFSKVWRRGGKIIAYHGVSDPIFSVSDTEAWYRGLARNTRAEPKDFARLYRVPGMGHCSGGPATDQADFLTPLVAWVEAGQAPEEIVATARGAGNPGGVNPDLPSEWAPNRSRPLCPFPKVAHYAGAGDAEQAQNWTCVRTGAPQSSDD